MARLNRILLKSPLLAALALSWTLPASALPSFARQSGQPCTACHVGAFGPQLTAFGREFKLRGYTMKASDISSLPLSAMMVVSHTHTAKAQSEPAGPHDGTNNNVSLQELSLFYAGRISEHLGVFSQATYSDIDRHVALDNVELRYAKPFSGKQHAGVWGVSVNNNPGLSDLRHTIGAWRFPFMGSELAPGPSAGVLIDEGLGQQVIGADAFVSVDGKLYASFGLYKTLSESFLSKINADFGGRIDGAAPYWRVSWQPGGGKFSLGASGLSAHIQPDSASPLTDRFSDVGLDASYETNFDNGNTLTLNGSFVHEHQRLDAAFDAGEADRAGHSLDSTNLNASYYIADTYGFTLAWFGTSGTADTLIYAPEPDAGSLSGNPDSRGEILQADWTPFGKADSWKQPWMNVRFGVQYVHYDKFNGASNNYDGFGRNASDNDTLFLFAWLAM